jgi:tripartite-type tricarboxylate transporter receptor subunit TctC
MWRARDALSMSTLLLAACVVTTAASPQEFPNKPVSIIVAVAPGSAPDVTARILADSLSRRWKQQVLVINRPGGSGVIAGQAAATAAADGHNLFMALSSAFAILPESKTKLPFDLATDFATIGWLQTSPWPSAYRRSRRNSSCGDQSFAKSVSTSR